MQKFDHDIKSQTMTDIALSISRLSSSNCFSLGTNPETVASELAALERIIECDEILSELSNEIISGVILPKISEEDPGLFFSECIMPASKTLKSQSLFHFDITDMTAAPIEYRLTPVISSGHEKLVDKLLIKDSVAYFFPCFIGQSLSQTIENVKKINCETSLVGFHDGWLMVLQNPEFFLSLCEGRALWFSGINSETSGIGFCLETGGNGDFQLWRRPFSHIRPEDFHGLVVTS